MLLSSSLYTKLSPRPHRNNKLIKPVINFADSTRMFLWHTRKTTSSHQTCRVSHRPEPTNRQRLSSALRRNHKSSTG